MLFVLLVLTLAVLSFTLAPMSTKRIKRTKAEWHPIATAPRDGTAVIVVSPGLAPTTARFTIYHPNAKGKLAWRTVLADYKVEPTHWLPVTLPSHKDLQS